ncbi:hypothetical protein CAPTEDRAFT_1707 [Capitella teleta]|uniref:Transporter n=1 Tax=Capitella teleta TaxID=283909 RepID=R7TMB1_CAPTE|nr:hypothetical protein CAPTEDRAFT_1707 [Capitella teleta]|eukprot:ELT92696.1 hypothetical protein CAPTEDRAFT_1707 [Capitella teleta]
MSSPRHESHASEAEDEKRETWSGKLDFILSLLGYAVGLGNVWRFPYRAYDNGGASFLIPYMALGQFSSQGPISVWNSVPFFKGLGWAMVMVSALCSTYYNMIIAYTIYYVFASFTSELPWTNCKDEWIPHRYEVLDISTGIEDGADEMNWQLVLCLLFAWVIIFLCLIKGIKSSGKVVYVTATFPYVVLLILLVKNATLDGAMEGIKFYVVPEWDRLKDVNVWAAALTQIFYSLGIAFGSLGTMASYNKFNNNVYRDAVLVAILNCGTSVFAGFVIFSVIGFMSVKMNLPVSEVVDAGPGLAFVAYPEGLSMMPIAPFWSILFFLMLFTLGLDSQFAMMETVITSLVDEFKCLQGGRKKMWVTLTLCITLFLLGLPQCSRAGVYVMNLFEWYSAGFSLMVIAFFELVAICYIYGIKRFFEDIEMMIGHKPNYYWLATWMVVSPVCMVLIVVFSVVSRSPVVYNSVAYPEYADWLAVGTQSVLFPSV